MVQSFIDEPFAVDWLSEVSIDKICFYFRIFGFEVCTDPIDFGLRCQAIENNIVISFGKRMGNSQTDSTKRSSDTCNFIGARLEKNVLLSNQVFLEICQSIHTLFIMMSYQFC